MFRAAMYRTVLFAVAAGCMTPFSSIAQPPFSPPKLPFSSDDGNKAPNVSDLIKNLTSSSEEQRLAALEQIQAIGAKGKAALTSIKASLSDESPAVRLAALEAIAAIGSPDPEVLKQLRARMAEANTPYEKMLVARMLAELSPANSADLLSTLNKGLHSGDEAVAGEAALALGELGPVGLPTLTQSLADSDPTVRALAAHTLGRSGARGETAKLAHLLKDPDEYVRATAATALGAIGPASAKTVPQLVASLRKDENRTVRAAAARALGQIDVSDPEAVKALAEKTNDDAPVARQAIRGLMQLAADPQQYIPLLTALLSNSNQEVRGEAMQALAAIGPPAIPALAKSLDDPAARYWAVLVLSEMGKSAAPATANLAAVLPKSAPDVQIEILLALGKIGPEATSAVPAIVPYLSDKQPALRYAATYAIASLGVNDPMTERALSQNASSDDPLLQLLSNLALAKLKPRDPTYGLRAFRAALAALRSNDPNLQQAAAVALAQLEMNPASALTLLPELGAAFGSSDLQVREGVIAALAAVVGKVGVDPLERAIHSPLRPMALRAAELLGDKASPLAPSIAAALSDPDAEIRADAALALAAIGPGAAATVPQLTKSLTDPDSAVRYAALLALGRIGPEAQGGSKAISALLSGSGDEAEKSIAASALAAIDSSNAKAAELAIPYLVAGLQSKDTDQRIRSAEALGRFGKLALKAIPSLEYATQDPEPKVRSAAAAAIKAIGR